MTDSEALELYNKMEEMFGDKLPDPEHCPKEFQYYIKLYFYEKFIDESNRNI